ncbi:hypothetical protein K7X08_037435 [Anisodus acutangulus]|uniref:Uncharacterized protein n=1 Tax=Anisodus acutangulus TaxID=402998 RepID=A0A9Q1RSL0_9SOLA|nr:hypothetical protein K7X08_037435 [Anisodus acutangulus]
MFISPEDATGGAVENGGAFEKKSKPNKAKKLKALYDAQEDIQLMQFADYFGRAFTKVSSSQFPWMKILRESSVEKMVDHQGASKGSKKVVQQVPSKSQYLKCFLAMKSNNIFLQLQLLKEYDGENLHFQSRHAEPEEKSSDPLPRNIVDPHRQLLMVGSNIGFFKDNLLMNCTAST